MNGVNGIPGNLPVELTLQHRQLRAGCVAQVCELKVSHGRVWVTQEGRSEDFWLQSGAGMVLMPGALVVIEADHLSSLRIDPVALLTARAWLRLCRAGLRGLARALCAGVRGNASALLHGMERR